MKATKIKMKPSCGSSNDLIEIDEIHLSGSSHSLKEGFHKKAKIYDHLKIYSGTIQVDIYPYPDCIPAISVNSEKYVKSKPDSTQRDNLLKLPRV